MAQVRRFDFKLGGMRKADSFIVYPRSTAADGSLVVQGKRTIARIEGDGTGWLNWRGSNYKGFAHLSPLMGGERVTFPVEFLRLVVECVPNSGDVIGSTPLTGTVRPA